jgi:DNA-binding IclR family transcriptional regulator
MAELHRQRGMAGALALTGPRTRIDGEAAQRLMRAVMDVSRRLTQALGG